MIFLVMYWFVDIGTCPTYMFSFHAEVLCAFAQIDAIASSPFGEPVKRKIIMYWIRLDAFDG